MKVGLISDTHNLLRPDVLKALMGVDAILHAGDISGQAVLDQLQTIAPVYAVRGNADKEWAEEVPTFLDFELNGLHIYMTHKKKDLPAHLDPYDLVMVGHSHTYVDTLIGKTRIINTKFPERQHLNEDTASGITHVSISPSRWLWQQSLTVQ